MRRRDFLNVGLGAGAMAAGTAVLGASHLTVDGVQSNDHVTYHWDTSQPYRYDGVNLGGYELSKQTRLTRDNVLNRPYTTYFHQHPSELLRQREISRGNMPVQVFEVQPKDQLVNETLVNNANGEKVTFAQHLKDHWTDALLVIHRGVIVSEQYFNGMTPEKQHYLWSVSKSVAVGVIANLLEEGLLKRAEQVTQYVPELNGTGYEGATIGQLLKMSSGVGWELFLPEHLGDPDNPNLSGGGEVMMGDDTHRVSAAALAREFRAADVWAKLDEDGPSYGVCDFMRSLKRVRNHGEIWSYKNPDTYALTWAACNVCDHRDFGSLVSEYIWQKIGAEHDAAHHIDSCGTPPTAMGFIARGTRDLGRYMNMLLNDGQIDGCRVVPDEFIRGMRFDHDPTMFSEKSSIPKSLLDGPEGRSYNDQFWIWFDGKADGAYAAHGFKGQYGYNDPKYHTTIIKLSTYPHDVNQPELESVEHRAFRAVARSLNERG